MQHERIRQDPAVMVGKPVIAGTRITVELILRQFGHGATDAEILRNYPQLKDEDLRAALLFAADSMGHRFVIPDAVRREATLRRSGIDLEEERIIESDPGSAFGRPG